MADDWKICDPTSYLEWFLECPQNVLSQILKHIPLGLSSLLVLWWWRLLAKVLAVQPRRLFSLYSGQGQLKHVQLYPFSGRRVNGFQKRKAFRKNLVILLFLLPLRYQWERVAFWLHQLLHFLVQGSPHFHYSNLLKDACPGEDHCTIQQTHGLK